MKKLIAIITATFILTLLASLYVDEAATNNGPRTILLTDRNTVSLNMPVNGESASAVQNALMEKASRLRAKDPIYLTLNSPGGSIFDGEKIIETAKGLPNKVHTISIFSASMSFVISQYLSTRYVLDSGVMMSHRAYAEGLSGQVPGNLVTRTLGLLSSLNMMSSVIAQRAGMSLKAYNDLVQDELWMRGKQAVDLKFADEVVQVQCDRSLFGGQEPKVMTVMGFLKVKVTWAKCPLVVAPLNVEMPESGLSDREREDIYNVFYNRRAFLNAGKGQ